MSAYEVLRPVKGHSLYVVAAFVCIGGAAALTAWAGYTLLVGPPGAVSPTQVAWVGLLWIVVVPLVAEPGRYVTIDDGGRLSVPTMFRRRHPKFLAPADVGNFAKVGKRGDSSRVVGVVIRTKDGKHVRYSDARTPGCSERITGLMTAWKIREDPHSA